MRDERTTTRLVTPILIGAAALLGLAAGGCGAGYGYDYGYGYGTTYGASWTPRLVAVDGGVWAVTGYPDPVFWGGDYYWMYRGGDWYRSSYLGGWNHVGFAVVPPRIRYIDRPYRYRRYVAPRSGYVRRVPRAHYRPRAYRPYRYDTRVRQPSSAYRGQRSYGDTRVRRPPAERRGSAYPRGPSVRRVSPGTARGGDTHVRRPR